MALWILVTAIALFVFGELLAWIVGIVFGFVCEVGMYVIAAVLYVCFTLREKVFAR